LTRKAAGGGSWIPAAVVERKSVRVRIFFPWDGGEDLVGLAHSQPVGFPSRTDWIFQVLNQEAQSSMVNVRAIYWAFPAVEHPH
jgi:hypothetical protein